MHSINEVNKEDGASSVLVIIMMVVLLVFGLAVLTTSLSNVRLGERKRAWLAEYYLLEGSVAARIASVDQVLLEAEVAANTYMAADDYMDDYLLDGPVTEVMRQQVFALAYDDYVMEYLTTAMTGFDETLYDHKELDVDGVLNGAAIEANILTFKVALPESPYDKHIQVSMAIFGANPDNLDLEGHLIERYRITRHTQAQEAFQYDEDMDFGDPFEEGDGNNPFAE